MHLQKHAMHKKLMPKIFKMNGLPFTKRAAKSEAKMMDFEPGF